MNCDHYKELISAHLDGEINDEQLQELNAHLEKCSECAEFKSQLEEIIQISEETGYEHMPRELETEILEKTVDSDKKSKSMFGVFSGYYRIPRGLVWLGGFLLVIMTLMKLPYNVEDDKKADVVEVQAVQVESITIQPVENVLTVQKVIIDENDIISQDTLQSIDPI